MGQHAPALQRHRETLRRRSQRHPAADVGAEAGLGIAAVMAHPEEIDHTEAVKAGRVIARQAFRSNFPKKA